MFTSSNYPLRHFLWWTRREIFLLVVLSGIPTIVYALTGWKWLGMPWLPIAMVGTAVAFLIGFKNNASYSRVWEARIAWSNIVNASRSLGTLAIDFLKEPQEDQRENRNAENSIARQLINNHLAWLTALRFQLREPRDWETMSKPANAEYRKKYYEVEELDLNVLDKLRQYMSEEDLKYIAGKKNRAAQILHLQAKMIGELMKKQSIDFSPAMQMQKILVDLYRQQGACERIKNFSYPRQFATLNLFFVRIFVVLVPFGMLQEFSEMGDHFLWLTVPVSVLIGWVFMSMERVGEATENPFEGGPNDIPMTALSRDIEIDLLEMLDEQKLPAALQPKNNILM
jgi:ion channel-forming bestrophin family protein